MNNHTKTLKDRQAGLFFVVEGADCVGKTSVIHNLENKLNKLSLSNVVTNDPNSNLPLSSVIRKIALSNQIKSPFTEIMAFCTARNELNDKIIRPGLENNSIVVCDRYVGSSIAYQIFARQNNMEYLEFITDPRWTLHSNGTFILTVDEENRLKRMEARGDDLDAFDKFGDTFVNRVKAGYDFIAGTNNPYGLLRTDHTHIIDTSNLTIDQVSDQILAKILLSL